MSDADLRELERRWRETGSLEDEASWLRGRTRTGASLDWTAYSRLRDLDPQAAADYVGSQIDSGALEPERVQLAACVGEPGALAFCLAGTASEGTLSEEELLDLAREVYMPLLGLRLEPDESIRRLGAALRCRPRPLDDVLQYLGERDWRAHLVGLIGFLSLGSPQGGLEAIWECAKTSWVGPQGAVVAYLSDPAFKARAADLVTQARFTSNSKLLAALLALHERSWPDDGLRASLAQPINDDQDRGDRIALRWLQQIEARRRFLPVLDPD